MIPFCSFLLPSSEIYLLQLVSSGAPEGIKYVEKDAASLHTPYYRVSPEEAEVEEGFAVEQCQEVERSKYLADTGHQGKVKWAGVSGPCLRMSQVLSL